MSLSLGSYAREIPARRMEARMKKTFVTLFALACLALSSAAAFAAVPNVIPYQGRLTDAAGNPVNGAQNLTFRLFNVVSGVGAALYTETQNGVTVTNGLFNVSIGSVTPLPSAVFSGGELFLEIQAGAETMTPRQRLGTVAYAFRAGVGAGLASSFTGALAPNGTETLTSVTCTFPAAGVAYVSGYVAAGSFVAAGTSGCYGLSINTVAAVIHGPSEVFDCFQNSGGSTAYREGSPHTERGFAVTPGAQTFFLIGDEQVGQWSIYKSRLSVMFFPDAIGTVTTTATSDEEPAERAPTGTGERMGNSQR